MKIVKLIVAIALILVGLSLLVPHAIEHIKGPHEHGSQDHTIAIAVACLALLGSWLSIILFFGPPKQDALAESMELRLAIEQLSKNYKLLRSQTRLAFALSAACVVVGSSVVVLGILMSFGIFGEEGVSSGTVTTLTGVVVDVVSGIGMYLYNVTFKQMNRVSASLQGLIKLQMLFEEAGRISDEAERT